MAVDIEFQVDTEAVPQPRPKLARMGNFVRVYTPLGSRIAAYKKALIDGFLAAAPEGFKLLASAIKLDLDFVFERPSSRMKEPYHDIKPDTDNLLKCTMDCLTGTVWHDDAQVVSLVINKRWADTYLGGKSGRKLMSGKSFVHVRIRNYD